MDALLGLGRVEYFPLVPFTLELLLWASLFFEELCIGSVLQFFVLSSDTSLGLISVRLESLPVFLSALTESLMLVDVVGAMLFAFFCML